MKTGSTSHRSAGRHAKTTVPKARKAAPKIKKTGKAGVQLRWMQKPVASRPAAFRMTTFIDEDGRVAIERAAKTFGMSKGQFAETAGLSTETLHRTKRAHAPKTQARVREVVEIITRVGKMAGGPYQAMAWYRAEPIPAFGGRTAESLVKDGKATAVRDYLDSVALGAFA
jgi:uncharacterized protein (DUF2384 family)